jgi:hypothetical protein
MANAIYDIPYRVPGNLPVLRDLLMEGPTSALHRVGRAAN